MQETQSELNADGNKSDCFERHNYREYMQLCIRLCLCNYWELRESVQICSESIHFVTRAEGVESFSGWRDVWKSGGVVAIVDLGGGGVAREGRGLELQELSGGEESRRVG